VCVCVCVCVRTYKCVCVCERARLVCICWTDQTCEDRRVYVCVCVWCVCVCVMCARVCVTSPGLVALSLSYPVVLGPTEARAHNYKPIFL
jgi:hypothetical protein